MVLAIFISYKFNLSSTYMHEEIADTIPPEARNMTLHFLLPHKQSLDVIA
jgi:hypothetical protein